VILTLGEGEPRLPRRTELFMLLLLQDEAASLFEGAGAPRDVPPLMMLVDWAAGKI